MRRRFLRRVGLFVAVFFGLVFAANAIAVALLSGRFGHGARRGIGPPMAILGLVLLVGFVATGRAVRRMARPMGDLMEAADRVAAGDYAVRVDERGPGEMRRLARAFNAMTGRLEASEKQRRDLLADIAHELRTPLSVIQGNAEGILDGLYPPDPAQLEPVVEEIRVMSRLLDDLQTLSTAEAGALIAAEVTREQVFLQLHDELPYASTVETEQWDDRPDGSVRIGQVISNLLRNALQHTPRGGSVVVAADEAEGGAVAFSVEDTGTGIAPDALPWVFDRFVKAADSGGAGLGLAIARSLVEAHGGQISASSRPGLGTTVRFVLPSPD